MAVGTLYMLLSVVVALYQQRNVVLENRISPQLTPREVLGCFEELHDVSVALEKHLENAYHLLGGYDSEEARRWTDEGEVWRKRWRVLGERCRLVDRLPGPRNKDIEAMAAAHEELGNIRTTYTEALKRFAKDLVPRLGRLDKRLAKMGEALAEAGSPSGDKK